MWGSFDAYREGFKAGELMVMGGYTGSVGKSSMSMYTALQTMKSSPMSNRGITFSAERMRNANKVYEIKERQGGSVSKYDISIPPDITAVAGALTLITGTANTGKTRMLSSLMKEAFRKRPFSRIIYIDSSNSFQEDSYGLSDIEKKNLHMVDAKSLEDLEIFLNGKSGEDGVLGQIKKGQLDCSLIIIDDLGMVSSYSWAWTVSDFIKDISRNLSETVPLVCSISVQDAGSLPTLAYSVVKEIGTSLWYEATTIIKMTLRSFKEDGLLVDSDGTPVGKKISYMIAKSRTGEAPEGPQELWVDFRTGKTYNREELIFELHELEQSF